MVRVNITRCKKSSHPLNILWAMSNVDDERSRSAARLMTAHQMSYAIQQLTGFKWIVDDVEVLDNDEVGYRVLLGGIDGRTVNQWLMLQLLLAN